MLEAVHCPCCIRWHLRFFGGKTRYKRDDLGNVYAFNTKRDAESARVELERGATGFPQNRDDHFRREAHFRRDGR